MCRLPRIAHALDPGGAFPRPRPGHDPGSPPRAAALPSVHKKFDRSSSSISPASASSQNRNPGVIGAVVDRIAAAGALHATRSTGETCGQPLGQGRRLLLDRAISRPGLRRPPAAARRTIPSCGRGPHPCRRAGGRVRPTADAGGRRSRRHAARRSSRDSRAAANAMSSNASAVRPDIAAPRLSPKPSDWGVTERREAREPVVARRHPSAAEPRATARKCRTTARGCGRGSSGPPDPR